MLSNVILLPMLLRNFSFWTLASVPAVSLFLNNIGHFNYDFFPRAWNGHWFAVIRRTHPHHACHSGDYGFQLTFGDRISRTRLGADAADVAIDAFRARQIAALPPTAVPMRLWPEALCAPAPGARRAKPGPFAGASRLAASQWVDGFRWPACALMLFLTLGIGLIHHNHTHVRLWCGRLAARPAG